MAFDEDMKMASLLKEDEEEEHHHSLSRLAVCSNFDGDEADDEPSDSDYKHLVRRGKKSTEMDFSDSDKGSADYQSLPATPPRRRRRRSMAVNSPVIGDLAYVSDNEAGEEKQRSGGDSNQRRITRTRPDYPPWVNSMRRSHVDVSGGYGGGVVVVTKPIGGGRPLCMDLGEVKACKDLGFELEPGRVSYSGSTLDYTSSGGNSPISPSHRISSPGDNPKDVKARLKAWAQAVAFVSTSHRKPPHSL